MGGRRPLRTALFPDVTPERACGVDRDLEETEDEAEREEKEDGIWELKCSHREFLRTEATQLSAQKREMDLAKLTHSVAAETLLVSSSNCKSSSPSSVNLPNCGLRNSADTIPSEVERDPVDSPFENDFEKSVDRYPGQWEAGHCGHSFFPPSELPGDVSWKERRHRNPSILRKSWTTQPQTEVRQGRSRHGYQIMS